MAAFAIDWSINLRLVSSTSQCSANFPRCHVYVFLSQIIKGLFLWRRVVPSRRVTLSPPPSSFQCLSVHSVSVVSTELNFVFNINLFVKTLNLAITWRSACGELPRIGEPTVYMRKITCVFRSWRNFPSSAATRKHVITCTVVRWVCWGSRTRISALLRRRY